MASMARGGVASMACGGAEEEQEVARPPWPTARAKIDEAAAHAEKDEAAARPPLPTAAQRKTRRRHTRRKRRQQRGLHGPR